MVRIAILGAPASGKTRLARDLSQHQPHLQVTDSPPLLNALLATRQPTSAAALQALGREHQRRFDLTLLTGLDLPCPAEGSRDSDPRQQQETDAWLRAGLQQAGIAYGVIYGHGPLRLRNALRLITPQDPPQPGWHGVCETCSDPDCEYRLFTGLPSLRAADRP